MSDEWATIGKDLEQKDLRQTERMNLVNILPDYKRKNSRMKNEWACHEMLQNVQKAQKCKLWTM